MSVGDSGSNNVPSSSGGYTLSSLYNSFNKFDIPVGTTIVSGPTITSPGYYYNPATPSTQTPINYTASLLSDANSPSGQVIDLSETTQIPGGDNYVQATMSVTLKASNNPPSNTYALNMLNVPPVGSATNTTDAGDGFVTAVTGVPLYGNVTATLTCWPFPNPQPAVVSTPVIDNVPPIVTIAAPGNNSQVVENSHVAANFSCIDPPTYGNGIASCTATNDGNPIANGALIATGIAGSHNVVVTAINNSGYQTVQTSNYSVILPPYDLNPPTVSITSPTNGQQVITGSDDQCRVLLRRHRGIRPGHLYRYRAQRLADQHGRRLPHLHGDGHGQPRQPDHGDVRLLRPDVQHPDSHLVGSSERHLHLVVHQLQLLAG